MEEQYDRVRKATQTDLEVDFEAEFEVFHKKVVGHVSNLSYYQATKEDV